ncbi:MAG: thioredoxin family protein [Hyphomicrobium sp.]
MSRVLALAAALLLALLPPTSAVADAGKDADVWNGVEIDWRDMRRGVREATETGKPVLMLFQATWCTACKKYRSVFKDPGVVAASRDLVMILIDIDKDPEINSGFAPDGLYVPRTIFLDASGEVRSDLKGADPKYPHSLDVNGPSELLGLMKKAAAQSAPPATGRRADGGDPGR